MGWRDFLQALLICVIVGLLGLGGIPLHSCQLVRSFFFFKEYLFSLECYGLCAGWLLVHHHLAGDGRHSIIFTVQRAAGGAASCFGSHSLGD